MFLEEDDREESLLYQPMRFMMDENGFFYIEDAGNSRIAVFDENGRYSHSIGRKGNGPGEFQATGLHAVRNGLCTVYDFMLRRASVFRTNGEFLSSYQLPMQILPMGITKYLIEDIDRRIILAAGGGGMGGADPRMGCARALICDANGDTLWFEQTPMVQVLEMMDVEAGGNSLSLPAPILFGPMPGAVYHPEYGFLLAPGDQPVLNYYDTDGMPRLMVEIEIESGLVSREERAELRRYFEEQLEIATDFARPIIQKQRDSIPARIVRAPWSNTEIDDSGYTWLQIPTRTMVASAADSTRQYRIVSPEGEYLGITTRPKGIHYHVSHGFLLANYAPIGTGEYELAVYRIRPLPAGLDYPN